MPSVGATGRVVQLGHAQAAVGWPGAMLWQLLLATYHSETVNSC